MGSIELKLSCSFCLRTPQPNPVVRQPSVHPPPSTTDRSYSSRPTIRERGSISAGRVPLRLIHPSPPRERKPRTKREESTYGGASGGTRERERAIQAVARKSKRQKTERGKEGKGWENEDPQLGERKGGKRREASRAPRTTHHILLSRLPTLTAGSVPDRPSRMPTTCAGREESHARHPAC